MHYEAGVLLNSVYRRRVRTNCLNLLVASFLLSICENPRLQEQLTEAKQMRTMTVDRHEQMVALLIYLNDWKSRQLFRQVLLATYLRFVNSPRSPRILPQKAPKLAEAAKFLLKKYNILFLAPTPWFALVPQQMVVSNVR